jgi:ABC-type glycerol-3-phosphate transport system permease component
VSQPIASHPSHGAWVLAAGIFTAVLAWVSLTTVPLLSQGAVLAITLAVLVSAAVVARRQQGRQRWLALSSGALVVLLPLLLVVGFLAVSGG